MPTQIIQKFQMNSNNQITDVGNQTLETIQSTSLLNQSKAKALLVGVSHNGQESTATASPKSE